MTDDDLIEAIREAVGYALHREAARRVLDIVRPTGWRVVPEEATVEMIAAWYKHKHGFHFHDEPPPQGTSCMGAYRAMLAASPSPPLPKTRDDDPLRESFA